MNNFPYKKLVAILLLSTLLISPTIIKSEINDDKPTETDTKPPETDTDTKDYCTFEGIIGKHPKILRWLLKSLIEINECLKKGESIEGKQIFENRLILRGPPGNGKTTIACKFAEESGSKLFELDGPSIVGRYLGQGAESIRDLFEEARDYVNRTNQTAVIVVDEIDIIAANNDKEHHTEHEAALKQLWKELDRIKNDPRFLLGAIKSVRWEDKTF